MKNSLCVHIKLEIEGTMSCLLHYSPKFYINAFLFVGLTSLVTLVNFDWLFYEVESSRGYFVYHHWEFIEHFLIPLGPLLKILLHPE